METKKAKKDLESKEVRDKWREKEPKATFTVKVGDKGAANAKT